jgi:hypothetical protein
VQKSELGGEVVALIILLGLRRVGPMGRLLSVTSLRILEDDGTKVGVIVSSGSLCTSFFLVRGFGVSAPKTLNGCRTNLSLFAFVDNGESVLKLSMLSKQFKKLSIALFKIEFNVKLNTIFSFSSFLFESECLHFNSVMNGTF